MALQDTFKIIRPLSDRRSGRRELALSLTDWLSMARRSGMAETLDEQARDPARVGPAAAGSSSSAAAVYRFRTRLGAVTCGLAG